jgi:16S rRNA (guanine527-N7)-methyltransferase
MSDPELARSLAQLLKRFDAVDALAGITAFLELLIEWNTRVNLVSRRSGIAELIGHVSDSLEGLRFLPSERDARLLDVGSGGGFPALPLLLARRRYSAVLVESTGKKATFLSEACVSLGLTATVLNARFPDSLKKQMTPFDFMTSRAVADPLALAAAARPFLTAAGRALLWTTEAVLAQSASIVPFAFHRIEGSEQKGIAVVDFGGRST